jgi:glycosyltransferase involved in cell wall biosynthesis
MKKITIYGAGETATYEELGAIELLKANGVTVEVILSERASEVDVHSARLVLSAFGVEAIPYRPGSFEKREVVVSFGRQSIFPTIRKNSDRPRKMVYGFGGLGFSKEELKANSEYIIDEVFVKSRSKSIEAVKQFVKTSNRGVAFRTGYVPYCNPSSDYFGIDYQKSKTLDCFHVIRNTPDKAGYCFRDHWLMVAKITCPPSRNTRFTALNWGKNLSKIAGNPGEPSNMWHGLINATMEAPDVRWALEKETLYRASVLLHFYPEEEAFSFSAAKAMLSGAVVVAGPTPAFLELIEHGETGFFAKTPDEAAYHTSRLAWEPFLRMKVAAEARSWFIDKGPGNGDNCFPWWKGVVDV